MATRQLDLFATDTTPPRLTTADIDEWAAELRTTAATVYHPHEWARAALSALLGEDIPDRCTVAGLRAALSRARQLAAVPTDQQPGGGR